MCKARNISVVLVVLLTAWTARAADYIWWEGEAPTKTNFPGKSWIAGEKLPQRQLLSGGDWLAFAGKLPEELFATYTVQVEKEGEYNFWCRKFWQHGPFRWRLDQQEWRTCGRDIGLADSVELRQYVCANWVHLGKVKLAKGEHTFELRLLAKPGESDSAAFDCFALVPGAFYPRGKLKPGERLGLAEPGYFAWEPPLDHFGREALLDLRPLNEKTAGASGFVRSKGQEFVLGSGQPVRFWAVNVSVANARNARESADYLAAKLAKLGVNMVRFHGPMYDFAQGPSAINAQTLDDFQYLVAALKKQGIYTALSFYFPIWVNAEKDLRFAEYAATKNKHPFAILEFDPRMQAIHRAWAKTILTTRSPYSGVPLAEDPALAIVEIQNEDGFFFWTMQPDNVPDRFWKDLEKQFGAWAAGKYGSLEKALATWGGKHKGDDAAAGRAGLQGAWFMTPAGLKHAVGGVKRMGDQVEFFARLQKQYYEQTTKYLKDDLKVGGLVAPSNWYTCDQRVLDSLERWTYTSGNVIDRHGYFDVKHEGPGAGWSVTAGHTYEDRAPVLHPEKMPFPVQTVVGYPHIITEVGFVQPNRFRADATLLTASYSALQGTGGVYFFAVDSNFLCDAGMRKFQVADPVTAGTFPATALLYRRGDVREGPAVVQETLVLADLFALKGSAASTPLALDAFRAQEVKNGPAAKTAFDPLSFYAGRVTRTFGEPSSFQQQDLSKLINRAGKTVTSATGELAWDYGNGLLRVNTPRAQGVAGFLGKAGRVELGDVSIESGNEYGSIVVIALDDQPLKTSKKILVQAMTEDKPYGYKAASGKILDMGGPPWNVRKIEATVQMKEGNFVATALDENGYAAGRASATSRVGSVYTILTR